MLSLTAFSTTASAEEIENSYIITVTEKGYSNTSYYGGTVDVYPDNDTRENALVIGNNFLYTLPANYYIDTVWKIVTTDDSPIAYKGSNFDIGLYNAYYSHLYEGATTYYKHIDSVPSNNIKALIIYKDGSSEYITDNIQITNNASKVDLTFTFSPDKDIQSIEFHFREFQYDVNSKTTLNMYLGEIEDSKWTVVVNQDSKEVGLLGSISEGISGIKNGISNLFNSIVELPQKLWNLIADGLKSLFVPDDDFILNFKNDMDTMLADKLGAVYQVIDITVGSWDRIKSNDENNIINLPETTINLPDNNTFSFGGYDIPIVPQGFDFLATTIKTVVGIVCTILFVNGLKRKYEEVMGGN